jgi:hypothetical protein
MNASLTRQVVDTADEVRELKARVACLEESVRSLRAQLIILRDGLYDALEGRPVSLLEVGR